MAVGNFENCLPIILHFEGGKSNDPVDPGGRTNKGITQRTYDSYRTRKGEMHADVYAIADAEVADCYKRDYWDAINGDALQPGEDLAVFDFAVNSGPAHALHVWHEIEGAGGPNSTPQSAIRDVCSNRIAFMRSLSTWPHFGPGWARRVGQVQQYGLAMAGGTLPVSAKIKIKPGHVGGAVIVAGGAAAAGAHWFGSPLAWTAAIVIGTAGLAIYVWSIIARAQQMMAAKAHAQAMTQAPAQAAPAPAPASTPTPQAPTDALEAAMIKVAGAKAALASAIVDAFQERDALIKQGIDLQVEVAAAEARLAAMGVDVALNSDMAAKPTSGGQDQTVPASRVSNPPVHHLKADDLIVASPVIGPPG
jgi:lysozyme family protein